MLDDLSVVLAASEATVLRVGAWVERLRESPDFAGATIVVAYPPDLRDPVHRQCTDHDEVAGIEYDVFDPGMPPTPLLERLHTGYFTIVPVAAGLESSLSRMRGELEEHRQRIGEATVAPPGPVLLHHSRLPAGFTAAFTDHMLQRADTDPASAGYLAHLALSTASVQLDWLEPAPRGITVSMWLNLGEHSITTAPPWRFRATLQRGSTIIARSRPTGLTVRTSAVGAEQWNTVVAQIPLTKVLPGDYRIGLELEAPQPFAGSAVAKATPGALASARTVRLSLPTGQQRRTLRYLLHTPARGRGAVLRIGPGGRAAGIRWRARLVRSDLSYAWRGRADGSMRFLRLLRLVTLPLFAGRTVWLIGERADEAQDNGYVFFEYLRAEHPRLRAYYILRPDSPRFPQIKHLGNVVAHSSVRHRLLLLHARVLANSQSLHHMLPPDWPHRVYQRQISWRVGALRVFLQHGVHLNPHAVKRGNSGYDVFLTSAAGESAALRRASGYDRQIAEVGLPRFDRLTPTGPSRTILFMPTWRRYLPSELRGDQGRGIMPLEGSGYERFITSVLTSRTLASLLDRYDYTLVFIPHYNVARFFTGTHGASDRITVIPPHGDAVPRMISTCDVLITDHSSVHFDAAYLRTPIVYAQFDNEEYEHLHGAPSWFDFRRDGFGPVTYDLEQMLAALEQVLRGGARMEQHYADRVRRILTHHDTAHCERTYAAITDAYARSRGIAAP